MSGDGTRNTTLNQCAFNLGQLIAGGELEHDHVFYSLLATAQTVGLKPGEAKATIESGLKGGMKYPRSAPEKDSEYYFDPKEITQDDNDDNDDKVNSCRQMTTDVDGMTTDDDREPASKAKKTPQNIAAHIKEWITNSTGSFTTEQLDKEFCLSTRKEKQNRDVVLRRCLELDLIKRDKRIKGKYHILDTSIEWIDLDATEDEPFPIQLPFDLHEYVKIPQKAVLVLAGSSNAGKTALILNTLNMNLKQKYEKLYLMSEMGQGEFKGRVKPFGNLDQWKKVKAASKSYDFDGAIQHYNQDGLTCIDFLEEVEGEYFKIASSIRDIYDAIGNGVAMIAIQKKTDTDYARGGQATMEKARLYMTLDYIATKEHSIVCALKLVKVKHWLNRNLQNYEIHFELTKGSQITPLTNWMPSSKVDRKKMAAQYESGFEPDNDDDCIYMKTDKGNIKRVTFQDAEKWAKNFAEIDVVGELERISQDSFKKPFLKDNGWFHQLAGILRKRMEVINGRNHDNTNG